MNTIEKRVSKIEEALLQNNEALLSLLDIMTKRIVRNENLLLALLMKLQEPKEVDVQINYMSSDEIKRKTV